MEIDNKGLEDILCLRCKHAYDGMCKLSKRIAYSKFCVQFEKKK